MCHWVGMKFENVNWDDSPALRRFWTDEEMLGATNSQSPMTARMLQRRKLIVSAKAQRPTGAWARAWTTDDILMVAVTNDLSHHLGVSIAAAVEILALLPQEVIDAHLLAANDTMPVGHHKQTSVTMLSEEVDGIDLWRRDDLLLALCNRHAIYYIDYANNALGSHATLVGSVAGLDTKNPIGKYQSGGGVQVTKLLDRADSALLVHLARLGSSALAAQFDNLKRIRFYRTGR